MTPPATPASTSPPPTPARAILLMPSSERPGRRRGRRRRGDPERLRPARLPARARGEAAGPAAVPPRPQRRRLLGPVPGRVGRARRRPHGWATLRVAITRPARPRAGPGWGCAATRGRISSVAGSWSGPGRRARRESRPLRLTIVGCGINAPALMEDLAEAGAERFELTMIADREGFRRLPRGQRAPGRGTGAPDRGEGDRPGEARRRPLWRRRAGHRPRHPQPRELGPAHLGRRRDPRRPPRPALRRAVGPR